MFICNHCPFVVHVAPMLSGLIEAWKEKSIGVIAISSNDIAAYPQDGPEFMKKFAAHYKLDIPYLFDETQEVAKAYDAACTPDFYLFDAERRLVYRGQLDDSRPSNGKPVDGRDLRAALDAVLSGTAVSETQVPSIGCNIKWKPGNEPDYF